jgi:hypothetical protein
MTSCAQTHTFSSSSWRNSAEMVRTSLSVREKCLLGERKSNRMGVGVYDHTAVTPILSRMIRLLQMESVSLLKIEFTRGERERGAEAGAGAGGEKGPGQGAWLVMNFESNRNQTSGDALLVFEKFKEYLAGILHLPIPVSQISSVWSRPFRLRDGRWVQQFPAPAAQMCVENMSSFQRLTTFNFSMPVMLSGLERSHDSDFDFWLGMCSGPYSRLSLSLIQDITVGLNWDFEVVQHKDEDKDKDKDKEVVLHSDAESESEPESLKLPSIWRDVKTRANNDMVSVLVLENPSSFVWNAHITEPLAEFYDFRWSSCRVTNTYDLDVNLIDLDWMQWHLVPAPVHGSTFGTSEMELIIPSRSTTEVRCQLRKRYLHWESFPPDASRGMAAPPPLVAFSVNNTDIDNQQILPRLTYFEQSASFVLVSLPIPDATMPYNVLTLVSSLAALLLGTFLKRLKM